MKCLIKCTCTDGEIPLDVRNRNEDEDIRDYMGYVQNAVGKWHANRGCDKTELEYLKMRVTDGKPIGAV